MLAADVARWFVWLVAFAWGAAWGSFFNVAIYRWPRGMSVVTPPSHCPSCGEPIRPWTNVPILGWLFLRGKASCCGSPISARYPLVELAAGLNIVTGETGAGKSILVDALQLVLGARGRPEVVRTDTEAAEVEAMFDLTDEPEALAMVRDKGVETDGELLVRRVVSAGGRTRAYINGRLATLAQLREVTKGLADISSQHEYHSLADPRHHLAYLDAFGQHGAMRDKVTAAYEALVQAAERLEEVVTEERGRIDREDLLRYQVNEIDSLGDVIENEEELSVERERLRHAEKLGSAAGEAEARLYADDDSICGALSRIASSVEHASTIDPDLEPIAGQIRESQVQLEDAASELGRYARDLSYDPARLAVLDGQDPGGRILYEGAAGRAMDDGQQWKTKLYDPEDEAAIIAAVEAELKKGGLGIAYPIGYYTLVGSPEIMAVTSLAAKYDVPITTHVRYLSQIPPSGYLGLEEMLTVARTQDVPVLVHHVQSNCLGLTDKCLDLIDAARAQGQKIVGEFYPWNYAGTYVDADYNKPGFEERMGIQASDYKIAETGEPLTNEEFDRLRKEAPTTQLLMYTMKDEYIMEAFTRPGTIVGCDAMPYIVDGGRYLDAQPNAGVSPVVVYS